MHHYVIMLLCTFKTLWCAYVCLWIWLHACLYAFIISVCTMVSAPSPGINSALFVSGQNCSGIIILLRSFFLRGLDWWIPLPPSPHCHIRLTATSTAATGWLSLLPWQPLLTGGPLRRLRPTASCLHLPLHPSHSSTTSITTTTYTLTYSQAAESHGGGRTERERHGWTWIDKPWRKRVKWGKREWLRQDDKRRNGWGKRSEKERGSLK